MTLIEEMQSCVADVSSPVVQRLYSMTYVSNQALARLADGLGVPHTKE